MTIKNKMPERVILELPKKSLEIKYSEADVDRIVGESLDYERDRLSSLLSDKPVRICQALGIVIEYTGEAFSFNSREYLVTYPDDYLTTIWSPIWADLDQEEDLIATCLEVLLQWAESRYKVDVSDEYRLEKVEKARQSIVQYKKRLEEREGVING